MEVVMKDIKSESRPFKFPSNVRLPGGDVITVTRHGVFCSKEEDHTFNSMGQCSTCGSHRNPAR